MDLLVAYIHHSQEGIPLPLGGSNDVHVRVHFMLNGHDYMYVHVYTVIVHNNVISLICTLLQ